MDEALSSACVGLGNVDSRLWLAETSVSKMQGSRKDVVMPLGTLLEKVSLGLWVTLMLKGRGAMW